MKLLGAAALVWGLAYLYTSVFGTYKERRSEERRACSARSEPAPRPAPAARVRMRA